MPETLGGKGPLGVAGEGKIEDSEGRREGKGGHTLVRYQCSASQWLLLLGIECQ